MTAQAPPVEAGPVAQVQVKNSGYSPDQPVELHMITQNTQSCTRALVIPSLRYQQILPATGDTLVKIPAQAPGKVIPYTCSMGMFRGQLIFK